MPVLELKDLGLAIPRQKGDVPLRPLRGGIRRPVKSGQSVSLFFSGTDLAELALYRVCLT